MTNQTARASHPPRRPPGGGRTCTPCTVRRTPPCRARCPRRQRTRRPSGQTRRDTTTPRRVARDTRRTRHRTGGTLCHAERARVARRADRRSSRRMGARPIDGACPRITPQADALHLRLTEDPADATRVPLSGKKPVMRRTTPVECSAVVLCRAIGRVGADKAVVAHVAPDSRCEAAVVALAAHTVKDNARPARKTSFPIASRAQRAKRLRACDTRTCRKTEPIGARDDAPSVATSALSGTVHARPCLSTPRRRRTLPCRGTPRSGRRHRGHTPSLRVSHRWRTSGRG